eukprot:2193805-Pleurochrysis_carterae.AAC.1
MHITPVPVDVWSCARPIKRVDGLGRAYARGNGGRMYESDGQRAVHFRAWLPPRRTAQPRHDALPGA